MPLRALNQHSKTFLRDTKYFLKILVAAIQKSKENLHYTIQKSNFLDEHREQLNDRQLKVVQKMLDAGPEGGMNSRKYMSIAKTSKVTATQDLQKLLDQGVFTLIGGGGRSTSYQLNFEK